MEWSDAQRAAIEARGSNLLVSAAAGSGKTAVLAERIRALVRDGARVDDMLVVTFTNAAAAEMRARIMDFLHAEAEAGDARMAQQAMRVERADISTLHRFCAKVCREFFQAAGVDPTFRIADAGEAELIAAQALEESLIGCFEQPSAAFSFVAECYEQRELLESIEKFHRFLMARPDPWAWLEEAIQRYAAAADDLPNSPWMQALLSRVEMDAEEALNVYQSLLIVTEQIGRYEVAAANCIDMARRLLQAAREGYGPITTFKWVAEPRKPNKPKDADPAEEERFAVLRDEGKKLIAKCKKSVEFIADQASRAEDLQHAGLALLGIAEATRAFHDRFTALKEEKNLLDYGDLEHFALRSLRSEEVAEHLKARYQHIFVDEYQDFTQLQEAILSYIVRPDNLFMVGDVKQSIYRFRMSEPALFLQKLTDYEAMGNAAGRRILLSENYRAHPTLLQAVNDVFRRVFIGGAMELTYDEGVQLRPGKAASWPGAPVELHLVKSGGADPEDTDETPEVREDDEEDTDSPDLLQLEARESIRLEAEIIADRILALRAAPEGGYAPKDIAVLMRTIRGKAALVVDVLRERGVAAWSDIGEDALTRSEIMAMTALLRVIDNFRQDVPLMAAVRGPALRLSEEALAKIRAETPDGTFAEAVLSYAERSDDLALALRGFIKWVRDFAVVSTVLPLEALLRRLAEEIGFYAYVGALPDGEARQASLRQLAEHAGAYQRIQGGDLTAFLSYLERLKAREGWESTALGEMDDVVRVMSIHKSKGLQFPVVFVAGLGRRFGQTAGRQVLKLHAEFGVGLMGINPQLRTKVHTISEQAVLEKQQQEDRAEEARMLYVAMTRAERRLILVGTERSGDVARWDRAGSNDASAARARSMLDWLVPSATQAAGWRVQRHDVRGSSVHQESEDLSRIVRLARDLRSVPAGAIGTLLSWRRRQLPSLPLKQGVTAAVKVALKSGELEDAFSSMMTMAKRPLFLEARGLTAAERGDAVHIFLRAVPFHIQDAAIAAERLASQGILSPEQARTLPISMLTRFLSSELWARIQESRLVRREWAFNLRRDDEGIQTLLQGVIDCCFWENDGWVLVDYKTDHIAQPCEAISRYKPQLALYAEALESITREPVRARLLVLLETGEIHSI